MRIACPACNAAYQVPDDQLAEGRVVRCARCGTDWAPLETIPASDAEADRADPPPPPPPVVEPREPEPAVEPTKMALDDEPAISAPVAAPVAPVLPRPPAKPRRPVLLVLAWVVSLAVVGGALAGLYVGRERVMKTWPPSIRAYAPLGLAGRTVPAEAETHTEEAHGSHGH